MRQPDALGTLDNTTHFVIETFRLVSIMKRRIQIDEVKQPSLQDSSDMYWLVNMFGRGRVMQRRDTWPTTHARYQPVRRSCLKCDQRSTDQRGAPISPVSQYIPGGSLEGMRRVVPERPKIIPAAVESGTHRRGCVVGSRFKLASARGEQSHNNAITAKVQAISTSIPSLRLFAAIIRPKKALFRNCLRCLCQNHRLKLRGSLL